MSGLLVSTWTSGLLPWLANPFPVTANRYLKVRNDPTEMRAKALLNSRLSTENGGIEVLPLIINSNCSLSWEYVVSVTSQ